MYNEIPKSSDQISRYLNEKINLDTKLQIANFAVLWNCFEHLCKDYNLYKSIVNFRGQTVEVLDYDLIVSKMRLSIEDHNYIKHIAEEMKRYLIDKGSNYTVDAISDYFDISYNQLKNYYLLNDDSYLKNDDLIVLLIITKKVRNNMYHGSKRIYTLDSQIRLFEICNKLLMFILFKLECEDILRV